METVFTHYWVFYLVSIAFIPVVITRKKKPVAAVAWILTILFLPIVGVILFFMFGTDRIVNTGRQKLFSNRRLRKRLSEVENGKHSALSASKSGLTGKLQSLAELSRRFGLFDVVANNRVEILVDADETYGKMEEVIARAEHHINLEYYIFEPDATGERFRDLLLEKAQEGVKVHLLYDAIGSHNLGWHRSFLHTFQQAGVDAQDFLPLRTFFKPWNMNLRNHRKICIVDNKVGFTGSLNIGDEFVTKNQPKGKNWRETHVMIEGPAVTQLQWIFCEDWYFATGEELLNPEYFKQVDGVGQDLVQVVASGPDEREAAIHKAFLTAISQAEKSVYLTTPYFIPDHALNITLQIAALRGIDVRILVPLNSDHRLVWYAGRSYYDELLQSGVKIFEYARGYLHAKMLVVDGHFTAIGSANVDLRSFSYNFEVNAQIFGETLAKEAERIFFADCAKSRKLTFSTFSKRSAGTRFCENLCRLFSPLL